MGGHAAVRLNTANAAMAVATMNMPYSNAVAPAQFSEFRCYTDTSDSQRLSIIMLACCADIDHAKRKQDRGGSCRVLPSWQGEKSLLAGTLTGAEELAPATTGPKYMVSSEIANEFKFAFGRPKEFAVRVVANKRLFRDGEHPGCDRNDNGISTEEGREIVPKAVNDESISMLLLYRNRRAATRRCSYEGLGVLGLGKIHGVCNEHRVG